MSYCQKVAVTNCAGCGERVAVKLNRSGLAYYRCDECGLQVQHHSAVASRKFLEGAGVALADGGLVPAEKTPEKPAKPKAAPGSVASMFGL